MKRTLFLLCLTFSLFSCTNESEENLFVQVDKCMFLQETGIQRDIMNYFVHVKCGNFSSRMMESVSLSPFIYKGDTVMYIVNYADGWDLISTDHRVPMVMASSVTGSFNEDDASMPSAFKAYLNSMAEELYQVKHFENKNGSTYGLWQIVSIQNDEVDMEKVQVAPRAVGSQPGNGHWELIEVLEPKLTVSAVDKLTNTKWNQSSPWNAYIPYSEEDSTQKGPAGCVAVALAQYLYFLHFKDNNPASTVTTAIYNVFTNQYTYSGNSTAVWNEMAINSSGSSVAKDYVATFIGYVGKSVNTDYHLSYGAADFSSALSFLNAQTGGNYYQSSMDYGYVSSELSKGRAVLAAADGYEGDVKVPGHTFVIDAKEERTMTTTSVYGWVGTDNLGNDSNERDSDGNIVGYSFFYERDSKTVTTYFKMNWGGGSYDDTLFNISDEWNVNGVDYNNKGNVIAKH